jgi:PKD repeat protein
MSIFDFALDIYYYMMPYMFEPYNAYQQPSKKKHWMEIAEEEALYHRMLMEAQKIEEAKHQQMTVNNSIQNGKTIIQTQTNVSPAAGAGGVPPLSYFIEAAEIASFTFGANPIVVGIAESFVNTTNTPGDDIFLWNFGSGSLTSTSATPSNLAYTTTGSFTVSLQSTSSLGGMTKTTDTLVVTAPTLAASFDYTTGSNAAPMPITFSNTTTYNGAGTLTYRWQLSGSNTSTLANPSASFLKAGSYNVQLQVTESSVARITSSCVTTIVVS